MSTVYANTIALLQIHCWQCCAQKCWKKLKNHICGLFHVALGMLHLPSFTCILCENLKWSSCGWINKNLGNNLSKFHWVVYFDCFPNHICFPAIMYWIFSDGYIENINISKITEKLLLTMFRNTKRNWQKNSSAVSFMWVILTFNFISCDKSLQKIISRAFVFVVIFLTQSRLTVLSFLINVAYS